MISYLKGRIILKKDKFVILDVNGVGYKIFFSQKTISKIPSSIKTLEGKGEKLQNLEVFCFLDVKETSLNLYGFLNPEELELFEILEAIRGIGPKASLEISSLGPLEKIKKRILSHDEKLFEGIPGIGRKKAMTIILELSGKIKEVSKRESSSEKDEAEDALVNLGFSRQQAKEAISKVPKDIKESGQKIKEALKILGKP